MYGKSNATFLVISKSALDQAVLNALEAAAKALGHASDICVAVLKELPCDLNTFIMQADPWSVVAIDNASVEAVRAAFPDDAAGFDPDSPVESKFGYTFVAVPAFAQCLNDQETKRIAWGRLKAARHPGNPLNRQRPKKR